MSSRTYSELAKLETFEERFEYLKLDGQVGQDTFGFDRIFNQMFYKSKEWKSARDRVIVRDNGCDLGHSEHPIRGRIIIHHLNPITLKDIENASPKLFDLDNLVCTSHPTHNAVHYGDESLIPKAPIERKKNDTCPWRRD